MVAKRFGSAHSRLSLGRLTRACLVMALTAPLLAGCFEQSLEKSQDFEKRTAVGKPIVLHLQGKPKMGYFWQLNSARSSGLDLVRLDRLGWTFDTAPRGSGAFTKPGVLRYGVMPKKAGSARLVFEYFRKEPGASASASWTFRIDIAPTSVSRR